jgi:hypothetical protein
MKISPFPVCGPRDARGGSVSGVRVRVNAASSFQTFTYTPHILHKNIKTDPNLELALHYPLMVTQTPNRYRFSGDKILLLMVALPYGK